MVKIHKSGPKNGPKYPSYVRNIRRDIETLPLSSRVKHIHTYGIEIKSGKYFFAKRIIDYVVGSDHNPEVLEAAREALAGISPDKLGKTPFKLLGFDRKSRPYTLGALFEALPQVIAVRLFLEKYLLDQRRSFFEAADNAGQTLLSFSAPDKAARFLKALKQKNPKVTEKIILEMWSRQTIREYKFKRYALKEIAKEIDLQPAPSTASRPEAKKKLSPRKAPKPPTRRPKKIRIKASKAKSAAKPKRTDLPHYFIGRQEWISHQPVQDHIKTIERHGASIKKGFRYVVFQIVELVIGTNFNPQIVEAAKKAFSPITSYRKTLQPFEQFTLTMKQPPPPFFLGALFELLPEPTALQVFKNEFLRAGDFYETGYFKAGKSLLRFSSAREAARFMHALKEDTRSDLARFLKLCRRKKQIRNYSRRRYEMDEMLKLLEELG